MSLGGRDHRAGAQTRATREKGATALLDNRMSRVDERWGAAFGHTLVSAENATVPETRKVGSFSAIRMVSRRVLVLGWQGVRLDYERRGGAGASTTDRDVA